MAREEVTAKVGKEDDAPSATVQYDFGGNLEEAVDLFGDEVVFKRFKAAAVIDLQSLIRRHLDGESPKTEEEIQAIASEWKPGVQRARKSAKDKAVDALGKLSEEDREALLQELLGGQS